MAFSTSKVLNSSSLLLSPVAWCCHLSTGLRKRPTLYHLSPSPNPKGTRPQNDYGSDRSPAEPATVVGWSRNTSPSELHPRQNPNLPSVKSIEKQEGCGKNFFYHLAFLLLCQPIIAAHRLVSDNEGVVELCAGRVVAPLDLERVLQTSSQIEVWRHQALHVPASFKSVKEGGEGLSAKYLQSN